MTCERFVQLLRALQRGARLLRLVSARLGAEAAGGDRTMSTTLNTCGLICLGGSEKRGCKCASPAECGMRDHPEFPERRAKAVERHQRLCSNTLELNSQYGIVTQRFFRDLVRLNSDQFQAPTTAEIVVRLQQILEKARK